MEPAPDEPQPLDDEPTLDELYDHAPCGYLTLATDGVVVRVNQTFLDWVGYERDEIVDIKRFPDLLTVGGRVYYETHCAPLMTMHGAVREVALDVKCADGHQLPVLFGATAQQGEDGRPKWFRATVFDASHRRSYEKQLLASRDSERAAREQSEALQRLGERLVGLVNVSEIEAALVGELIGSDAALAAKLFRPSGGVVRVDPTYNVAESGTGVVGLLPLVTTRGATLSTLRVELAGMPSTEERAFLEGAAELGVRALERAHRVAALQRTARGGEVTGLPNQQWWRAELSREVRLADQTGHPLALLLVEINGFEQFSREHGHVAGDQLLLRISDAFRRVGLDLLSRHGGEEFVVLLPGQRDQDARRIVSDLRREPMLRDAFVTGAALYLRGEDGADLVARAEGLLADERRRWLATQPRRSL